MTKKADILINIVVVLLAVAIPTGLFLTYWYENGMWLFLSVIPFIIFMAG